jgi:hypothetical protein
MPVKDALGNELASQLEQLQILAVASGQHGTSLLVASWSGGGSVEQTEVAKQPMRRGREEAEQGWSRRAQRQRRSSACPRL